MEKEKRGWMKCKNFQARICFENNINCYKCNKWIPIKQMEAKHGT